MTRIPSQRRGASLIELIVVIAILVILFALSFFGIRLIRQFTLPENPELEALLDDNLPAGMLPTPTNLIVNGSFELGAHTQGAFCTVGIYSNAIHGWQVSRGT